MTSPFMPRNIEKSRDGTIKRTPITFLAGARNTPTATGAEVTSKIDDSVTSKAVVASLATTNAENLSPPDNTNKAATVVKIDPELRKLKPAVLQEKAHPDNFRRQVMDPYVGLVELVPGARAKLKQLNPEYWPFSFAVSPQHSRNQYLQS